MQEKNEQPTQKNPQVDAPSDLDHSNLSKNEDASTQNVNINKNQNKDASEQWQTGIEEGVHEKIEAGKSITPSGTGNNETLGIP